MTGPLLSPSWYRVAALTPRLRSHTELHRHEYRGETWYVLEDRSTERFHRFSPAGYLVIGLMDGRRTLQEVWDVAVARLGDDAPTQDEMIHLLSQLHAADVLQCDVPPDTEDLLRRYERQRRSRWLSNVLSPLSWRFPLVDPQRFLVAVRPLVQAVMGWPGVILWLVIVTPAVPLLASHWTDLTRDVVDRALVPQNLVYVWLAFPLIKACHELGHAFAVAAYGGEVHEMGVMLLVLSPVPYVDASAASAFREKWRRVLVGAAGMLVELALAALALFVWLAAQPGLVRTLAYNTILIAGVTTILFNANPLLRYDGYYILTDLLEIPNLRARASAYLSYLCERYAFGRRETERPAATAGERAWFVAFGVAASAYRVLVVVAIFLFLADKLFVLGKLLALVAVTWAVVPVVKAFRFVLTERRLRPVRVRAVGLTVGGAVALAAFLAFVPVPHRGLVEGFLDARGDGSVVTFHDLADRTPCQVEIALPPVA